MAFQKSRCIKRRTKSFMESDVDKVNSTVRSMSVLLQIHWGQMGWDLLIRIPFIDSNIDKLHPILDKHIMESRQQWSGSICVLELLTSEEWKLFTETSIYYSGIPQFWELCWIIDYMHCFVYNLVFALRLSLLCLLCFSLCLLFSKKIHTSLHTFLLMEFTINRWGRWNSETQGRFYKLLCTIEFFIK